MVPERLTEDRRSRLIALRGNRCINCGTDKDIEWHYMVPIGSGGNDVDTNLVPLCSRCGYARDNMIPIDQVPKNFKNQKRGTQCTHPQYRHTTQ